MPDSVPDYPFLITLPETHRYRALLLDSGGRILRVRTIIAGDDKEASVIAHDMLDGRQMELWDRDRFVERFGSILI